MRIRKLLVIFCMCVFIFLSGCVATGSLAKMTLLRTPEGLSHKYDYNDTKEEDYLAFKDKMNSFASMLGSCISYLEYKEGENIACAPISIEMCLGLAVSAANGKTRNEILASIGVDYETFSKYYKLYFNELCLEVINESKQIEAKIELTNSIWIDNDVTLYEKGLDDLKDNYYCYAYEADFDGDNKATNQAMRQFIREKTNKLLDPEMNIDESTMFVLMNTLYLKDIWNDLGNDLNYADSKYKFTNVDGSVSKNKLLEGYYFSGKTMNNDDYSAFYTKTSHGFKLHFIKANDGKDIKDVFSPEMITHVINSKNYVYQDDELMEEYMTKCMFPEFKAGCDLDITSLLKDYFWIKTMFINGECDFSNLTDNKYGCSEVRHISKLEVNKKGIEGAAVTYIAKAGAAGPGPYKTVYEEYVVDKEFGFVLTYHDIILFSGIVTNIDK